MIEKLYKKYESELNIIQVHMTSALESCDANSEIVAEFDRKARIDENILRHIVIREEE